MSNFQIVVLGIFTFFAFVGVVIFAGYRGVNNKQIVGEVIIWGTLNEKIFVDFLNKVNAEDKNFSNVTYVGKDTNTFEQELIESIASGNGPDIFLLSQDLILKNKNKAYHIPYDVFPIRSFRDSFISEAGLFLANDGIVALPFTIDPLVMYWNRSIFANAGIANPPRLWDEFILLTQKITGKDQNMNITQSAVALGEFRNISNAKEILSTMIMQTGNPITEKSENSNPTEDMAVSVLFGKDYSGVSTGVESAVRFFTEFSDPVKSVYSWNRSLPISKDRFISGDLGIYFGFASELSDIKQRNPNLDFDVAPIPQPKGSSEKLTYGKMNGLAISKSSKNISGALTIARSLSEIKYQTDLMNELKLPPVRRDLLLEKPLDPYQSIFYDSAIYSKAWLDPDPKITYSIFQKMVESITTGRTKISDAVDNAGLEIENLLK